MSEFELKLENSKILKVIIETLASIIDETEFQITPEEFIIKAMDPSRICLLKLVMKNEDFDEFNCKEEVKIGLNLDDLDKIMKRASSNDYIEISFTEDDNKIKVIMKREGQSRARTFSLATIDMNAEEVPMDNLLKIEYDANWVIDPNLLIEAIKDAEIYSEILNIKTSDKGLKFTSSGQIGEMIYDLDTEDLVEYENKGENTGAYSLTFLKAILKISSITEKLEISLKSDNPIKMIYNLLEGATLSYFLAPRIDEQNFDDDDVEEF